MRESTKAKRTGPVVGGGPGARWALAAGGVLIGVGGIMIIPPPPLDASAADRPAPLSATSTTGPAPATSDQAAVGPQQTANSQSVDAAAAAPQAMDGTAPAAAPPGAPTWLEFPELRESAPVGPVSVADDGSLGIPDNPQILGWWSGGAAPGGPQGAVVVDGHVDSDRYGIGFFVNLRELRPGEHVVLKDGTGARTRWRIVQSRKYPRDDLPSDALFSRDGPLRLILITCGGVFDHASHSYPDNLVVLAVPDGG